MATHYLQPGNTWNGDGSQADASAMTQDGDPGPFNSFANVLASAAAYGDSVIIVDGTYGWPTEFDKNTTSSSSPSQTFEGYHYSAQTPAKVIFDAQGTAKQFAFSDILASSGLSVELNTSFTGVVFQNVYNAPNYNQCMIWAGSRVLGQSYAAFYGCQFLNWIGTGIHQAFFGVSTNSSWKGMVFKVENCVISYAGDNINAGNFLGYATSANWDLPHIFTNNTFAVLGINETTVFGRNATNANGVYGASFIMGGSNLTNVTVRNNIFYEPGGLTAPNVDPAVGTIKLTNYSNMTSKMPTWTNNSFFGVTTTDWNDSFTVDSSNIVGENPNFVGPESNRFNLRPASPLIGRGV